MTGALLRALSGELRTLTDDIRQRGLLRPIVLLDENVIDGRNRLAASKITGVAPRFTHAKQFVSPWAYLWSANAERTHLPEGQKAAIGLSVKAKDAGWQASIERARAKANKGRSEKAKAQHEKSNPRRGEKSGAPSKEGTPKRSATAAAIAAELGVSRQTVERAQRVQREAPDLFEKVAAGEISLPEAVREVKRAAVVEKLESTAAKQAKAIAGIYDVIVCDPPWPMEKIKRDERPNQSGLDYPTLTLRKAA
jgi:hypothetical protein